MSSFWNRSCLKPWCSNKPETSPGLVGKTTGWHCWVMWKTRTRDKSSDKPANPPTVESLDATVHSEILPCTPSVCRFFLFCFHQGRGPQHGRVYPTVLRCVPWLLGKTAPTWMRISHVTSSHSIFTTQRFQIKTQDFTADVLLATDSDAKDD